MATINLTGCVVTSGVPATTSISLANQGRIRVEKVTVDLTGGAITDNDIYQVYAIPANTLIMNIRSRIDTAAVGTSLAMDIGIGGSNGWNDAIDGCAAAGTYTTSVCGTDAESVAPATNAAGLQGTYYATADTIDLTMEAAVAITAGPKVTLFITCIDFN
jgi:hypothetical protein